MSQRKAGLFAPRPWTGIVLVLAFICAACEALSAPATAPPSTTPDAGLEAPRTFVLGGFPEFPGGPLPESIAARLQAVLDEAIRKGTFTGVTAAVIIADHGSWTGAAGSMQGVEDVPLTPDSRLPTHSAAKNIVAA